MLHGYVVERIIVAYSMKQPPVLDDRLTNYTLKTIKLAPFLFLANAFWMLGNRQIFFSEWYYKDKAGDVEKTKHYFTFLHQEHTDAILFVIGVSILFLLKEVIFADYLDKFGFSLQSQELEVDEDLPEFYKSLT